MLCMLGSATAMAPERAVIKPADGAAATRAVSPHAQLMRFLMQPVEDPDRLRGYRIAILAADGVDGFDLEVPRSFLAERGATVHVIVPRPASASPAAGSGAPTESDTQITVLEPSGEQHTASFDRFVDQVQSCEYDLVYLPANRTFSAELALAGPRSIVFLQQAAREGKAIFAAGNAALVLLKAGLLDNSAAPGDPRTLVNLSSTAAATEAPSVSALIYTGRDAFDMPVLMDNLIATLLGRPVQRQ
jgi:protease I